jgi:hypothetical protein
MGDLTTAVLDQLLDLVPLALTLWGAITRHRH